MTTWTAGKSNETSTDYIGKTVQKSYSITGVAGNTGGTLTCTGLKIIDDAAVTSSSAAATYTSYARISGQTVVVTYVDPNAAHTTRVTVWGVKG
jgi:hypothetical protein